MEPIRVLLVDDHVLFAEALAARLKTEPGLIVVPIAPDVGRAIALVATERPDVVVLDLRLGPEDGFTVLDHVRDHHPEVRVLILTGIESVDTMVRAVRHGAIGWLPKTETAETVIGVIRSAAHSGGWIPPDSLGDVLRALAAGGEAVADPLGGLTPREREVLRGLVDGLSRRQIAERLGLSVNTVRTHTQNLLAKLGLHSALEAVTVALRAGMRPSVGAAPGRTATM